MNALLVVIVVALCLETTWLWFYTGHLANRIRKLEASSDQDVARIARYLDQTTPPALKEAAKAAAAVATSIIAFNEQQKEDDAAERRRQEAIGRELPANYLEDREQGSNDGSR
jgi:hypothetical protein